MLYQMIKIFELLNFWFITTYDLVGFMFALSEPSIKFEVLEMVLILVLVSVKLKNFYFEE